MYHYLSVQYSAIQKTILRHDRLWSISGMSHTLSEINEIEMRNIATNHGGLIIVAGGGKFTVRFDSKDEAERTRSDIERHISTKLPMLEYQVSSIVPAMSLKEAREKENLEGLTYPGIVQELSEKKRVFRGYGITYNPHLMVCGECEEYPVEKGLYAPDNKRLCRICNGARQMARIVKRLREDEESNLTSINRIYRSYIEGINTEGQPEIPLNMEDLFPGNGEGEGGEKGRRIAVWMSDVNSMGEMVPLWLMQEEERVLETFDSLKKLFIDAISSTLIKVFPRSELFEKVEKERRKVTYIPFRLIVAGGDDLCIVMPDRYILSFAKTLSSEMNKKIRDADKYNEALSENWLKEKAEKVYGEKKGGKEIKGISFGGAFVVTHIHTPFTRIHEVGEELMGEAKKDTERRGNSINWRILAADKEPQSDKILEAERPLLIEEGYNGRLSFNDYLNLCKDFKNISGSHLYQIVGRIIEFNKDEDMLERWLLKMPEAGKKDSAISRLINCEKLRNNGDRLSIKRLVTLFELLTLSEG
ncbi:MAG: hypothetical protein N2745_11145 [Syntrophorhabdaceae bacterium]|nr:hypothetical protein [Syntrophorhabdaceae bacterium]